MVVGGGPAGVVDGKLKVFSVAGVVEAAGARVDGLLAGDPAKRPPAGLFVLPKSPPPAGAAVVGV